MRIVSLVSFTLCVEVIPFVSKHFRCGLNVLTGFGCVAQSWRRLQALVISSIHSLMFSCANCVKTSRDGYSLQRRTAKVFLPGCPYARHKE